MARDFSYRITATDHTGPAVSSAVRSFDRLSGSAVGTSRAVESGFTRTHSAISRFTGFLGQQAVGAVRSFFYGLRMGIVGAGVAVAGFVASSINQFRDFDKKLRETTGLIAGGGVSSGTGDLASRMKAARKEANLMYTEYKQALQAMSVGLRQTPQNLAGGLYEVTSAGITNRRQALNLLTVGARGATAGTTYNSSVDPGASTKGLIQTLNALKIGGGSRRASHAQMQGVMDKIFQAVNLGVGVEYGPLQTAMAQSLGTLGAVTPKGGGNQALSQLLAMFVTGSQNSLTMGQMGAGYQNAIKILANPSKSSIAAAQGIGLDIGNGNGNVMLNKFGVAGTLQKILEALKASGQQPGSPKFVSELNGIFRDARGQRVVDTLLNHWGLYQESIKGENNASGSTTAAFNQQGKSLDAKIQSFKAMWANMQIALGGSFSHPFMGGVDFLTSMLNSATGGVPGAQAGLGFVNTNIDRRRHHMHPISQSAYASTLSPANRAAFDQYEKFTHAGAGGQFGMVGASIFHGIKAWWERPSTQKQMHDLFQEVFDKTFTALGKTIQDLPSIVDFGRQLVVQVLKGVRTGLSQMVTGGSGGAGAGILGMNLGGGGGGMNMLANFLMAGTLFKGTRGGGALKGGFGAAGAAALMGLPMPMALALGALSGGGNKSIFAKIPGMGGDYGKGGLENYTISANTVYVNGRLAGGGLVGGGGTRGGPIVDPYVPFAGSPAGGRPTVVGGYTFARNRATLPGRHGPYTTYGNLGDAHTYLANQGFSPEEIYMMGGGGYAYGAGGGPSAAEIAAARARRGNKSSPFNVSWAGAGDPGINYSNYNENRFRPSRWSRTRAGIRSRLGNGAFNLRNGISGLSGLGLGGSAAAGGIGALYSLMSGGSYGDAAKYGLLAGGAQFAMGGGLSSALGMLPELGTGMMVGGPIGLAATMLLMNPGGIFGSLQSKNRNATQVGSQLAANFHGHATQGGIGTNIRGLLSDTGNKSALAAWDKMAIWQRTRAESGLAKLANMRGGSSWRVYDSASRIIKNLAMATGMNPLVMAAGMAILNKIHAAVIAKQMAHDDIFWQSHNGGDISRQEIDKATKGMSAGGRQGYIASVAGSMAASTLDPTLGGGTAQAMLDRNIKKLGGTVQGSQTYSDAFFKAIFTPRPDTLNSLKHTGQQGPHNFAMGFGAELDRQGPLMQGKINKTIMDIKKKAGLAVGGSGGGGGGSDGLNLGGTAGGKARSPKAPRTIDYSGAAGQSIHTGQDPFGQLGMSLADQMYSGANASIVGGAMSGPVARARKGLAWLQQQVGKPYVWGTGHNGDPNSRSFDCSGLASTALQVMGYHLNGTTTSMIGGTAAGPGIIELGFNDPKNPSHMGIGIGGKWFEARGRKWGVLGPGKARTHWAYEGTPKFHKGGTFRTRSAGGEGGATLKDGEMVVRRAGDGGLVAHPIELGGGGNQVIVQMNGPVEIRSHQDIELVASRLYDLLNSKMTNSGRVR